MSLADIEIVKLIDQYVSIVHGVRAEEIDSASEFIEMAARLVQRNRSSFCRKAKRPSA